MESMLFKIWTKIFVQHTKYNEFVIVIPGFSPNEVDIRTNIPRILSDIYIESRKTVLLGLSRIYDNGLHKLID